jgi:hypothetical protein
MPEQPDSGIAAEIKSEALDILAEARQWQLAETRWPMIEEILTAMDAALDAGDVAALTTATADLELAAPLRIILIGPPLAGPTPRARDLLNKLVHSLGGTVVGKGRGDEDRGNAAGNGAGNAGNSRY